MAQRTELEPNLTLEEITQRYLNVSIKDKEHLKRWLEKSGRRWLLFDSLGLVDSLPFPEGIDDLMRVVACYRDYRQAQPSGRVEIQKDPTLGKEIEVSINKSELLEVEELDRAIRALIRQASERFPTWKLENPPL